MIHLIYDAGWLTAVVGERTDEMNTIIATIESGLSDYDFSIPVAPASLVPRS